MKRMCTICLLVALLTAILPCACADTTMYVIVDEGSGLNVREKPNTRASVCAKLLAGDEVNVLQFSDNWAEIDNGGEWETGWVSLDYLSTQPAFEPYRMTVSSNGRVRARECPDGKLCAYVHNGDVVTVSAWCGTWAKTNKGWVDGSFLAKTEDETSGE